jgi:DNA-directed RNA polymerase specialized sigma subunit
MDITQVKYELSSYVYDNQYYNDKRGEVIKINEQLTELSSKLQKLMPVSLDSAEIEASIRELIGKHLEEKKFLLAALEKKHILERKLNGMKQPYRTVLYFRYIRNMGFKEIAKKMNYSDKRIYQLHREALELYMEYSE